MKASTRRAEWAVVDVDDLPVPSARLHRAAIGKLTLRLAEACGDAHRLAADHADLAARVNPHTATANQIGGLRIAQRRAERAVEAARAAQHAVGVALAGKVGDRWSDEIDTARTVAARRVAAATREVATAAAGFETPDRATVWRDQARTAHTDGGRWPVGFESTPRRVVVGNRSYPLDVILDAIRTAYTEAPRTPA